MELLYFPEGISLTPHSPNYSSRLVTLAASFWRYSTWISWISFVDSSFRLPLKGRVSSLLNTVIKLTLALLDAKERENRNSLCSEVGKLLLKKLCMPSPFSLCCNAADSILGAR
jgi:hypothetical protein